MLLFNPGIDAGFFVGEPIGIWGTAQLKGVEQRMNGE